jgi:hypothetical protein
VNDGQHARAPDRDGDLRQDLTYHPANHFWPLQWTEAGVFAAIAVLLAGFCFWWIRRRLT